MDRGANRRLRRHDAAPGWRRDGQVTAPERMVMQEFPHHYAVSASATTQGDVVLGGDRLPEMRSAPPAEFGGPGDKWSPETLLVAAVADCFVLTFRAIAGLSRLEWTSLTCEVEGKVDRVERVTRFTEVVVRARLRLADAGKEDQAVRLLTKAEETCLVTNTLNVTPRLETSVEVDASR